MKILVIRHDMHGDIFVMTSILPGLAKKYPGATIDFLCNPGFEQLILGNPYINKIVRVDDGSYDLVLAPDHANQWNDWMPRVHCRIAEVEFNPPQLYLTKAEIEWAKPYEGCIALATTAGWVSRRYRHWHQVVDQLRKEFRIVQIDNGTDAHEKIEHPKLSLREMAATINAAGLYLGIDSAPMHVAAATCTPMVLVLGATGAEIQYLPCSTILRPYPYFSFFDSRYVDGIDINPAFVVQAVYERTGRGMAMPIVQHTDGDGNLVEK